MGNTAWRGKLTRKLHVVISQCQTVAGENNSAHNDEMRWNPPYLTAAAVGLNWRVSGRLKPLGIKNILRESRNQTRSVALRFQRWARVVIKSYPISLKYLVYLGSSSLSIMALYMFMFCTSIKPAPGRFYISGDKLKSAQGTTETISPNRWREILVIRGRSVSGPVQR